MIAGIPSLQGAMTPAIFLGIIALVVAIRFTYMALDDADAKIRWWVVSLVAVTLVTVAIITALTVMLYHAAWVDYRRGSPRR